LGRNVPFGSTRTLFAGLAQWWPGGNPETVKLTETIVAAGDRIRVGPFRGSAEIGAIVPLATRGTVSESAIAESVKALRARGFGRAVTSALGPRETSPFRALGFSTHHELHLLVRDLITHPVMRAPSRTAVRPARRLDWPRVLEIDALAFDGFWRFDEDSIRDALRATPSRRFHLTRANPTLGYHITGRAGTNGYLQRLAVDPDAHGQGLGRLLLLDSLSWLQRRSVTRVFVNTQLENAKALGLYEAEHFVLEDQRLSVLEIDLTD